uniref:Uncharacterized protein n=1 Tax=CrAss-like virus sp. ctYsL76 TaxID=2826826 RepID=A0A8S5QLJ2_9CAUD|nr:MAG TPA: hypothetical protein [CrAss-like virus sp. ctYsL76]
MQIVHYHLRRYNKNQNALRLLKHLYQIVEQEQN